MHTAELFLLALSLSMDAFAVSVCKGLAFGKCSGKALVVGLWFGSFQALMPLAGYYIGNTFGHLISSVDHWIVCLLLVFIGVQMIREARAEEEPATASLRSGEMFTLAVATSLDAFAIGITFALLPDIHIWSTVSLIGITTFALSALGFAVGSVFGAKYRSRAEWFGGIVLILLGLKILLEHLLAA